MPVRNCALFILSCGLLFSQTPPVTKLRIDASNAPQRLIHSSLTMPAKAGPLTLLYPEWYPGDHRPTGPIGDLVGLEISGKGASIPWRRDLVNMNTFNLDVPAGVTELNIELDFIAAPESLGGDSGVAATTELMLLSFNALLLHPKGQHTDDITFQATLKLPQGWRYATALPMERETGNTIEFKPSSLTTLVDSPLLAGRHFRTVDLTPGGPVPHFLHMAGDSRRSLETTPEYIKAVQNLVQEETALFGPGHYRSYRFLLTLSDHMLHYSGEEHHESSDNRLKEDALITEGGRRYTGDLFAHEMAHSWNGKYRRPVGLATKDYSAPMKGDLLWVYEGMTDYWGRVLAARSGLWTAQDFRDNLAMIAARLSKQAGRRWRPLEDTAVSVQLSYAARDDYADFRRGADYYNESTLIWLEADVLIRRLSGGKKSLDDFCQVFHTGGPARMPALKPYSFEDVAAALNQVQPYDWAEFLTTRIKKVAPNAPLEGISGGGWKLTYGDERSAFWKAGEEYDEYADFTHSIGISVKKDGTIQDVRVTSKAFAAGVPPATKLIAVNGRQYTVEVLQDALNAAKSSPEPIELLVKNGEFYKTHRVDYHDGQQYPRLERVAAKPDVLSEILRPKAR